MSNEGLVRQILKEEGSTGVETFYYNEFMDLWVMVFIGDPEPMYFSSFSELYEFITNGL